MRKVQVTIRLPQSYVDYIDKFRKPLKWSQARALEELIKKDAGTQIPEEDYPGKRMEREEK